MQTFLLEDAVDCRQVVDVARRYSDISLFKELTGCALGERFSVLEMPTR
jgi:hypothetical protein